MSITVTPISGALGAEIGGIDLSTALSDRMVAEVHEAMLKYHVLVFPGQKISDMDQVRFTRLFGELPDRGVHSRGTKSGDQIHKSVMLVSESQRCERGGSVTS